MFGMVGSMSAWVWARDLLKYQGIRQEQGWAGLFYPEADWANKLQRPY